MYFLYSALQVSCLAGVVNEQLSMSLYKLIAFVLCTITELSHCLFTLSSGQLSCTALHYSSTPYNIQLSNPNKIIISSKECVQTKRLYNYKIRLQELGLLKMFTRVSPGQTK